MENRVTRLLVPLLIAVVAWVFIKKFMGPEKTKPEGANAVVSRVIPADVPAFLATRLNRGPSRLWPDRPLGGEVGKPGFRVGFQEFGGTIKTAELWDYYAKPGKEFENEEHLYRAIVAENGSLSFAIEDVGPTFPVQFAPGGKKMRMENVNWRRVPNDVDPRSEREVSYELPFDNGLTIRKTFRFFPGSRRFQVSIRIDNQSDAKLGEFWSYRLRGATVLANPRDEYFMNPARVFAQIEGAEEVAVLPPSKKPNPPDYPDVLRVQSGQRLAFAGTGSRFFLCAMLPDDDATRAAIQAVECKSLPFTDNGVPGTAAFTNCAAVLQLRQRIPAKGDKPSELTFNVYLGPKDREQLEASQDFNVLLAAVDTDLKSGCFCAFGAKPLAKILLGILRFFYSIVGNWGVAIIMLTLLVRGAMMPINLRSQKSMREYTTKMQKLKPEMDSIKERFKGNQQRMNQELLKFQRKHKMFPPLGGCLPMFLTMPVFIGLFTALRSSFELRHQPFFGWIQDLSMPDRLAYFGELPYVPDWLNLLPILMGILWAANMFGQPKPADSQAQMQQRMMKFMPIMMLFFLYNYASGLAIYMVVSAAWTLVESRIVRKKFGVAPTMVSPI